MAEEKRVKNIVINLSKESRFRVFSRKADINFDDIKKVRNLFSNEKAKILFTLKMQKPKSIYELAKQIARDSKAVKKDLKLLEQFGFVNLVQEKSKGKKTKRIHIKPELATDKVVIDFVL